MNEKNKDVSPSFSCGYITVKQASIEFGCTIHDLVDCWLARPMLLDFYYKFSGESVTARKDSKIDLCKSELNQLANNLRGSHTKTSEVKIIGNDILFRAFGFYPVLWVQSTFALKDNRIKIISKNKCIERVNQGLFSSGCCYIYSVDKEMMITFSDIETVDGLEFNVGDLFVTRESILKLIE